jgi:transcriptional regulator with XRE-family HTH domain
MSTFFERLREERERLTFSQDAFGAIGGVQRRAQINYEKGERLPDIAYLRAIAKVGADVLYIVTGVRGIPLGGEEALLLEGFRKMDAETKRRTLAMVYGGTPPAASTSTFHVAGSVGNQVGSMTGGKFNIDMRKDKK